jgi:hypothetical protein
MGESCFYECDLSDFGRDVIQVNNRQEKVDVNIFGYSGKNRKANELKMYFISCQSGCRGR